MKQRSFEFNGIRKEYLNVLSRRKTYWAPVKRNFIYIPGRPGALVSDTVTDVRVEEVHVEISTESEQELRDAAEDLSAWLITEEPGKLIFDDEPDRMYYAVVEGGFDPDEIVSKGYGIITFIYPNSYKYGIEEKEVTFESSASFDVEGTVETEPIIEVTLKADTEYVAVSNGTDINMVGFPAKQEETPVQAETQIFKTSGENLIGWTNSSQESLGDAPMTGVLKSDGNRFYTDDYGKDSHHWHGPAMKTSLSEPVQDFRFEIGFLMRKTGDGQAGSIEVSLLDSSNKRTAILSVTKHFPGLDTIYPRINAGSGYADVISENQYQFQREYGGIMKVIRRGNVWTGEIFYRSNNQWVLALRQSWTDTKRAVAAPVTQVQVRLQQRGDMSVVEQWVDDIQVYRLNDLTDGQVPIIGRAGDKVIFDHANDNILKNGESVINKKAFIGNYFKLQPGRNSIAIEPANKIQNVKVRWRDKWR
ncbi:distal tail protein Dit [Faecalibacterium prausnitzii]